MHFVVLFVGCALFSTAFTLTCYECVPGASGSCTQKTCPSSTQCAAMRVTSYAGESKIVNMTAKSCAAPAECLTGSINFGRTLLNSKCCATDLCNSQTVRLLLPVSSSDTPNGKQCYTCNGQDCLNTLNCLGDENSCISTTTDVSGQKVSMKGCASKSMCAGSMSGQLLGMSFNLDCCKGNLCNDARSLAASLLLLVAPLLSVTLFH
ncbi:phospholipase A2 inhibitor and Ly6/PLAUR domain-containing protein-like [Osmerus eperlanus]|uniref:phospholipase A2 inhibitor and Ly6/PLAUR domain-containing protein-like n=1 Tax=Osmerus eperlanus TaxID=29151 RepID=UPI002E14CDC3